MGRLDSKVAIVTGAAQGIGAIFAQALAAEGASVVVADITAPDDCVQKIRAAGGQAVGCIADVTDNQAIAAMVASGTEAFGGIDILVNNAGIFANLRLKPFMEIDEEEWDRVMRVNVRGSFQCAKAVVPAMKTRGGGRIVNISSGTVFYGAPMMMHYVASKAAIIGLTRCLARELGDANITVNAITPGLTLSEGILKHEQFAQARQMTVQMRPLKREQTPEDLVGALLFLVTNDSSFITGQIVNVDGGRAMY
ncbi:MAG: SDR family NAD(P)-dependent oxidoreductase [Polaromonas sp.]